jgi:hypothetical protein
MMNVYIIYNGKEREEETKIQRQKTKFPRSFSPINNNILYIITSSRANGSIVVWLY